MTYTKPILSGYAAIVAIQASGPNAKTGGQMDPDGVHTFSQPAYEADE